MGFGRGAERAEVPDLPREASWPFADDPADAFTLPGKDILGRMVFS